jgi:hypothetical protein
MSYFYKINYHSTGVETFINYKLSYIQATVNLTRFYLRRNYVPRINNNSTNILKVIYDYRYIQNFVLDFFEQVALLKGNTSKYFHNF